MQNSLRLYMESKFATIQTSNIVQLYQFKYIQMIKQNDRSSASSSPDGHYQDINSNLNYSSRLSFCINHFNCLIRYMKGPNPWVINGVRGNCGAELNVAKMDVIVFARSTL